MISCSNSLHALPHRSKGRSRAERSTSVVALTVSVSELRTPLKASSSSLRSRNCLGWNLKLWTVWYSVILAWKAKPANVSNPEAKLIGSAIASIASMPGRIVKVVEDNDERQRHRAGLAFITFDGELHVGASLSTPIGQ